MLSVIAGRSYKAPCMVSTKALYSLLKFTKITIYRVIHSQGKNIAPYLVSVKLLEALRWLMKLQQITLASCDSFTMEALARNRSANTNMPTNVPLFHREDINSYLARAFLFAGTWSMDKLILSQCRHHHWHKQTCVIYVVCSRGQAKNEETIL